MVYTLTHIRTYIHAACRCHQNTPAPSLHPPPHFTRPLTLDDLVEFIRHHCIERYCLPTVLVLPNSGMHTTLPAGEHTRHSTEQHTAASSGGYHTTVAWSQLTSPQCACPVVAHPAFSGFCLRSQLTRVSVNTPLISLQIWAVAVYPLSPRWHAPCPAPSKTKQVDGGGPLGGCLMISCRDSHCVSYCVRDCSV